MRWGRKAGIDDIVDRMKQLSEQLRPVLNCRDLGGIKTENGRTIRSGLLFRSGGLHLFQEEELDVLRKCGIQTILDLRASYAWKKKPDPDIGAVHARYDGNPAPGGDRIDFSAKGFGQTGKHAQAQIETLQDYLRLLGAEITGAGSPVIRIEGFCPRPRAGMRIPSDRIAAATYLCCAVCAGGEVTLTGAEPRQLVPVLDSLRCMGCDICAVSDRIHIGAAGRPASPGAVVTRPYPGFPTDAAPLLMAACLKGLGPAMFIENIFSGRYRHAEEMRRFGADILLRGPMAMVNGVSSLRGAAVASPDLRGGAALVAAALGAEGESVISDAGHIPRGYDGLDTCLRALGADIWRE